MASSEYGDLHGGRFSDALVALTGASTCEDSSCCQTTTGDTVYCMHDGDRSWLLVEPAASGQGQDQRDTEELALSAAHELANALSAISGWAQLGISEPSKHFEALETIERAAASAARVARDVIDFRNDLHRESCDASAVCRDVAKLLHPFALRHQVRVETDASEEAFTTAHRAAVFRVVWNLALNATQVQRAGGSVSIRCGRSGEEIVIEVRDEGPGIERESQTQIFESRYSERPGGTGFGLATVKRTLERVGGSIALESEYGRGTVFTVRLARARAEEERESGVVPGRLPRRILVVEDDHGVRELIETTLGLRGIDVVTAVDLTSARSLASEGGF
ncbi:MAG: ATP-binding protein, partial [Myxococcota bacterium]